MEPLYLQSEDALYSYLKKFLKAKPRAVQLDGATEPTRNAAIMLVFSYSVTGKKYKLAGDTTRAAVEEYIRTTDEQGSSAVALREYQGTLILATRQEPAGWNCQPYVSKSSFRARKAA